MRAVIDVDMLIALLDARLVPVCACYVKRGWTSCLLTKQGCVRHIFYPGNPGMIPVVRLDKRLLEEKFSPQHPV